MATRLGFQLPAFSQVFHVECSPPSRRVLCMGQREGWSGGFELSLELNSAEFRFFAAV